MVGGPGGLPPGKNSQVNGGFTHFFFNSFTYKVVGNTPNEAGFIVPNFHLVRTDYLWTGSQSCWVVMIIPIPLPQHQHTFLSETTFRPGLPWSSSGRNEQNESDSFCSFRPDDDQGNPGRNVVSDKKVCWCWGRGIGIRLFVSVWALFVFSR